MSTTFTIDADAMPRMTALAQTDIEDTVPGGIAADRLRSIVERWERLEEEVKALRSDQKDILTECTSSGFCAKTVRKIIKERAARAKDAEAADAQQTLFDLYWRALEG